MVLTKTYRCHARRSDRKARINPFEPITGTTEFSEEVFPIHFETDDLAEMEVFVAEKGIIWIDPE